MQIVVVAALEAGEVAGIWLGEDDDQLAWFGDLDRELRGLVICVVRDLDRSSLLCDCPAGAEEAGTVHTPVVLEEVFQRDPKDAVVTEGVIEGFHSVSRPFFGPVGPGTIPFLLTPRVLYLEKSPVFDLARLQDGVGMPADEAFAVCAEIYPPSGTAAEEEVFVHTVELGPEDLFVEDVFGVDGGVDAAGEVFDAFACDAAFYRLIVSMGFCVGFLQ